MLGHIVGELTVMQLRLAGPEICLDEQTAGPAIGNDPLQTRLEGGASAEDDDGGYFADGLHAVVGVVRWCADRRRLDGDGLDGLFDHGGDEPIEVEDEFFAINGAVVQ